MSHPTLPHGGVPAAPGTAADGAADPLVGALLDRRYRVQVALARGGMATVYRGVDTRLDREVAVKVMHPALADDPDFVARFAAEARSAARVSSPHVVTVTDTGSDTVAGRPVVFLVMELVTGTTLRGLLSARGQLDPGQALAICDPVLAALAAAHAAGLVHRDVKPENVLLGSDGAVKVADFGLARVIAGSRLTATTGLMLGTVAYLAPEQVTSGAADARTDVYAAGTMLFELVVGQPPFTGDSPLAVAYRHVHERVPAPSAVRPELPNTLDELVLTATAPDPADRYPDAAAMLAALRRARPLVALGSSSRRGDTTALDTAALAAAGASTAGTEPGGRRDGTDAPPRAGRRAGAGRRRARGAVAALLVLVGAAGVAAGGYALGRPRTVAVRTVRGLAVPVAEQLLVREHLHPSLGSARYDDSVAVGFVVASDPGSGVRLKRGSTVVLHPSLGVETHPVPMLAGDTVAAAATALAGAHLAVGPSRGQFSDTVATGLVLASAPPAGAVLRHGTPVSLVVSQGPAPVTLPTVAGQPVTDATRTLAALGLTVGVTRVFSDSVPVNQVVTSNPAAGSTAHRGDTVTLTVSKGPDVVTVPDVIGMSADSARAALTALGLHVAESDFRGGRRGSVFDQDPLGGSVVHRGSMVTIFVV